MSGTKYDSQDNSVPGFETVLAMSGDGTDVDVLVHADHRIGKTNDSFSALAWTPDGRRLAVLGWPTSFTVDERGRDRRRLRVAFLEDQMALAPDGRHVAYFGASSTKVHAATPQVALHVRELNAGNQHTVGTWSLGRTLRPMESSITWSPDGSRLVTVLRHAVTYPEDGPANFSRAAHFIGLDGTDHGPIAGTEGASDARLSPDGKWIAFVGPGGCPGALYVVRVSGGERRKLGEIACSNSAVFEWSPDSRSVAFVDNRLVNPGVWVVARGGAGKKEILGGSEVGVELIWSLSWQPLH